MLLSNTIIFTNSRVCLLLPGGGWLGAEKRSSSVESPNKFELGLALTGAANCLIPLGLEENSSSSSSFSLSNNSAPFLGAAGLSFKIKKVFAKLNET